MTMDDEVFAHYYFLPNLSEGLASLISADAAASGIHRASAGIEFQACGEGGSKGPEPIGPPQGIEILGPGDVLGFNQSVITRCEPKRDVGDSELNYFPFVEFEQPDFPWRFTAASRSGNGDLKPWITLIVLIAEGDDKEYKEPKEISMPVPANPKAPYISVNPVKSLPDLSYACRWAHVQITTDVPLADRQAELVELIQGDSDRVVSRLLCARRLRPGTLYQAFVVPTYKLGLLAGLGLELDATASALDLAWDAASATDICLPYYYRWEFRTGLRGDFEALVRRLEQRELSGLGLRDVDCSKAGYGTPPVTRTDDGGNVVHTLGLEGALKSLGTEPTSWGRDADNADESESDSRFQSALAGLVNQPKADIAEGNTRPVVAPPIYGRWHAATGNVDRSQSSWIHELNLDPRHRMASAFGTQVVQKDQEDLMASAWDQVGAVDEANEILRRAQMGRESSLAIHDQRLTHLSLVDAIRVTSQVHARVRIESEDDETPKYTIRHHIRSSRIPLAALDPALRRIGRGFGPLRKRQRTSDKKKYRDMLERLNDGTLRAAGPPPDPDGALKMCNISFEMLERSGLTKVAERMCPDRYRDDPARVAELINLFCEDNITCESLSTIPGRPDFNLDATGETEKDLTQGDDSPDAASFRGLLLYVCEELAPADEKPEPGPIDLERVRNTLIEALDPGKTIVARTRNRLRLLDVPEQADPLNQIMVAPEFDSAMYKPLEEISQDLLLPGLETVPQNTLALLKTNGRFVESYMVGLNHEMSRELLWREYPTDQRGSYFRQFWDVADYIPTPQDEQELDSRLQAFLGERGVGTLSELSSEEKELILRRNSRDPVHLLSLPEVEVSALLESLLRDEFLEDKLKDIKPIHTWRESALGNNDNRPIAGNSDEENIVLLIRGDLLRKYPNTRIYAVEAIRLQTGERVPGLPEHLSPDIAVGQIRNPIFSGQLPPDVTFLGFDLTQTQVRADPGWFFVIEERVSESRFGMDSADAPIVTRPDNLNSLSWGHVADLHDGDALKDDLYLNDSVPLLPTDDIDWSESSAMIARITLQKPVRIAVHASTMIPDTIPS